MLINTAVVESMCYMREYDHNKIEDKWKEKWSEDNIYKAIDFSEKPKKYILAEFPYPSGDGLHVAQAVLRAGWVDVVGIGRAVLSYPGMLADAVRDGRLETRAICRTFSDCTTAPRNGMISGCYPLDRHYKHKPEAAQRKALKRTARSGPV